MPCRMRALARFPRMSTFLRQASVRRESNKGRMADALAHGGDEGRDKLR